MPHSIADSTVRPHDLAKTFTKCVVVQPKRIKTVGLGTYAANDPEPSFTLTLPPEQQEMLGTSLDRLDLPGSMRYMLFYQFNNFGEQPCEVTIERDV